MRNKITDDVGSLACKTNQKKVDRKKTRRKCIVSRFSVWRKHR